MWEVAEDIAIALVAGMVGAIAWSELRRRGTWWCWVRHRRSRGVLQPIQNGPFHRYCTRCGAMLEEVDAP